MRQLSTFLTATFLLLFALKAIEGSVLKNSNILDESSTANQYVSDNPDPSNVCSTRECIHTATEIQNDLDLSVKPCDDFFRFACGGWIDRHEIYEDQTGVSIFSEMAEVLEYKLRVLLEKSLTGSEPDYVRKVKKMYDSCMDEASIEASGGEPLKKVLQALGGWPVVEGEKWTGNDFDWMNTLIKMRELGYSQDVLINLSINTDPRNNTMHIITLDPADTENRETLVKGLENNSTLAYYKLMVKVAEKLGADPKTAETDMLNVVNFEISLANYSLPQEERRNVSIMYNKYDVTQLKELAPKIDWMKFLNAFINDSIFENDTLLVTQPSFIIGFEELINNTDKRVIANYLLWSVAYDAMLALSKDWIALFVEYRAVTSGQSKEGPRWSQCVQSVSNNMHIALSSYYVRNYFNKKSKDRALLLVNYIQKEFLNILSTIDWMDPDTRDKSKEKAMAVTAYIGYPDELLNSTIISEFYEGLKIGDGSHFDNVYIVRRWNLDRHFSKLRKPITKGDWKTHAMAHIINAYYEPFGNSIEFPAGILQKPLFVNNGPEYLNFGGIGFVIGHEITHGFDDLGRQFDIHGNNVNWWNEETDKKFQKKVECIINQYGNFTAENGQQLNGVNTQGENIADNGGLKQAYRAYQSYVKDHGKEPLLPGLKYTQNQLFFISVARSWCNKIRPESLERNILSDNHPPNQFRVNGPMSNLPEFSQVFQCEIDSKMNPRNKCEVW